MTIRRPSAATPPRARKGLLAGADGLDIRDTLPDEWYEQDTWAQDESAQIGRIVAGAYRLLGIVGRGAVGTVYEARHEPTGAPVAVKLLQPHCRGDAEEELRFLREGRMAASLSHPHVVRVLDVGRDLDGTPFQVQELLRGHDLATLLDRGEVTERELLHVARQVLAALACVHGAGFLHRDVKPENVFVSRRSGAYHATLLDFGIVKDAWPYDENRLTMEGIVLGTPYYMSPEQARGEPLDETVDLWALGALLYRGLCGRFAFDETDVTKLAVRIATEPAPSLLAHRPDLPPAVIEAVDRAMRFRPGDRWSTAKEMDRALATALEQMEGR
jgi:serine/threonine-protein kinase